MYYINYYIYITSNLKKWQTVILFDRYIRILDFNENLKIYTFSKSS